MEDARGRASELTQAARAGRDRLDEGGRAKLAIESRLTTDALVGEYIRRRVTGRLRTASEIEAPLKRAFAPVINRPADELKRRDLRKLLETTADGGHPREAKQRRVCLNGFFKWSVANEHLKQNRMVGLSSFGRSPPRQRVLSDAELENFWRWLDGPNARPTSTPRTVSSNASASTSSPDPGAGGAGRSSTREAGQWQE